MKISDILEPCSLKLITGDPERTISGFYACDLLSWVISHAKEGDLWVTVMNNIKDVYKRQIQRACRACARLQET